MALSPDNPLPDLPFLIETDQLVECLHHPKIRVIDASWHMKITKRNANKEYLGGHIPGAIRFDIDNIADKTSTLPHMVPSAETFARKVSLLGLGNDCHIIVYDMEGVTSAACRAWWMFRLFGHDRVSVLNGGLHKWKAEGRPLDTQIVRPQPASFVSTFRPELLRTVEQMMENIESKIDQVIDSRTALRFQGKVPEPWPTDKKGHVPGSVNLLFADLIDPESRCFLPDEQISAKFESIGFNPQRPVAVYCGSGVTACVTAFALTRIGYPNAAVYDGSWAEWGSHRDTPIEK